MNILLTYGSSGAHKLCFGNKNVYPCDAVAIYPHFMLIHTGNHFPSGSDFAAKFRNQGNGHTSVTPLYCSNENLRLVFPECLSNRHATSLSSVQIFE